MSERPICRTAEEAFAAGWDDGADDVPMTPEQRRRVLALIWPYRDQLIADRAITVELCQQGHSDRAIGGTLGVSHEQGRKGIELSSCVNWSAHERGQTRSQRNVRHEGPEPTQPRASVMEQPLAYRAVEAAQLLGIPYRTVMRLIHEGELGHRKAGRYYLVPRAEIERYLEPAITQ